MTEELAELKSQLDLMDGVSESLIAKLENYVDSYPDSDEAYFLLGNAYRRMENWEFALNAYQMAMDINPNSSAKLAYEAIQEVLAFYNKDMFNQ